jgi:hypothetical protein
MTCEKRNKWRWRTVIKQNAHRAKLVNVLHGRADSSDHSVISSMVAPASRFSNTADTGIRVSLNTHAPLGLPCRVLFFSSYPYQNCPAGDVVLDTAALQTKGVYDVYRTSPGQ